MEEAATTANGATEGQNLSTVPRSQFHSHAETMLLIECVRQQPLLWHREHLHKRASKAASHWEDIRRQHFPSVGLDQLKSRWKTLRDCFRRESRRSENSATPAPSRWSMYKHLQFLHGQFRVKGNGRRRTERPWMQEEPSQTELYDVKRSVGGNDDIKKEMEQDSSFDCGCEVTFRNKFRSRLRFEQTAMDADVPEVLANQLTDFNFLSSLTPYLSRLSARENLAVRIQMLQLLTPSTRTTTNPQDGDGH
uniref:MADF domain-containing protein n=1 Tax=Anopheles dirus TaxID=7168 RepID=A0A182MXP8_9DIPT